ncbi:MAG TPA: oxygen-dependent coproporphyrinogen oxidase [Bacteroidia bacterium]|jgi:coproporphyrinogen III oxidase|nr:oxygen-dependent coproporphyrinogen oxidase [Bacteroidia bacterium]
MLSQESIESYFLNLQNEICNGLEKADEKGKFAEDLWKRPEGGGGRTRIISNGNIIEKGGVNFSAVSGTCPDFLRKEAGLKENERADFYATGVSLVIHPVNPMVPIIHMNVRYLKAGNLEWFGGGIDLTPHYIFEEDAKCFHQHLKKVCDTHHASYYPEFKKWADDYFFISHRNETRGIGGIFFDRLSATDSIRIEDRFNFVQAIGNSFLPAYLPLIEKNKNKIYTEANKQWQLLRRGRYVEFNLVYDRGTKFGLLTNGRTESILMSLPPTANWEYANQPEKGSDEEKTLRLLKKGINWAE